MIGMKPKKPADRLDYPVDFSRWLPDGDTILTVVTALDIEDELVVDSASINGSIVTVWLSGGMEGKTYTVTVTAATEGGRIKEAKFKIRMRDC